MKRLAAIGVIAVLLLALAVPAFADTLGYPTPTPSPTDEPTTEPGGGEEEPTEEPTKVVDTDEPTQSGGDELADTGIDASTLALIAGGLFLAGGLGLLAARRAGKAQ